MKKAGPCWSSVYKVMSQEGTESFKLVTLCGAGRSSGGGRGAGPIVHFRKKENKGGEMNEGKKKQRTIKAKFKSQKGFPLTDWGEKDDWGKTSCQGDFIIVSQGKNWGLENQAVVGGADVVCSFVFSCCLTFYCLCLFLLSAPRVPRRGHVVIIASVRSSCAVGYVWWWKSWVWECGDPECMVGFQH